LSEKVNAKDIVECDVSDEESIKDTFDEIHKKYGKIDYIVHAIAFSDKEELKGKYIETSLERTFYKLWIYPVIHLQQSRIMPQI
jgi:enoyl-[acyl-carrier protein] reductase I